MCLPKKRKAWNGELLYNQMFTAVENMMGRQPKIYWISFLLPGLKYFAGEELLASTHNNFYQIFYEIICLYAYLKW